MSDSKYQLALGKLREVFANLRTGNKIYEEIVASKNQVLARYQAIFSLEKLDTLGEDEFKSFLYLENNHHWSGLYRQGGKTCSDMGSLRMALKKLLDENNLIENRLDETIRAVPGMGKALATAILIVVYPDSYGVWNNTSEAGLKFLDIWPDFVRGGTIGKKYVRINNILLQLVKDLGTDLWTLDAIWWVLTSGKKMPKGFGEEGTNIINLPSLPLLESPSSEKFQLEKHLEEFLLNNWSLTVLGKEWQIYSEEGDELKGNQYPTEIGQIDILAKHKEERRWLVIELKRDQSADKTIGQILRYMGWVKRHMAQPGELVDGMVIAHGAEKGIQYALETVPNVSLMLYEVKFFLHKFNGLESLEAKIT